MANDGLWLKLLRLDPQATAGRAKCRFLNKPDRYIITLLNSEYIVNLAERRIFSGQAEAGFTEQLCILAYLINAQPVPPAGKLVKAEALPGGEFFFRGPHSIATGKLEEAFGQHPERLYEVAQRFDAGRQSFGDVSIRLYALPRIPLTVVLWRADDEFGARVSILFDRTAAVQLPLDALWAVANLTVNALLKAADSTG